jgi:hypothetical protein
MKNITKTLKMLPVLFLAVFVSCSKGGSPNPDGGDGTTVKTVTGQDMLNYYIVGQRKSGTGKLAVLYFTQDGSTVKTNFHRMGVLRVNDISVSGSTLKFDGNNDGKAVYTFEIEKSADGSLKLKSYQYVDTTDPAQGLDYAVLVKKTDAIAFENSSFKAGDLLFKFSTAANVNTMEWDIKNRQTGTKYYPPPINQTLPVFGIAPEVSKAYYSLADLGWKANDDAFIGVSVSSWTDSTTPVMLVERNSIIYEGIKQ